MVDLVLERGLPIWIEQLPNVYLVALFVLPNSLVVALVVLEYHEDDYRFLQVLLSVGGGSRHDDGAPDVLLDHLPQAHVAIIDVLHRQHVDVTCDRPAYPIVDVLSLLVQGDVDEHGPF